MNWYSKIKRYYDKGYYSVDDVKIFVEAGKITEEQFKEITGVDFNLSTDAEEENKSETSDEVVGA